MSETLLATETEQPQDATTTQGGTANVDTQPAPQPQQPQQDEPKTPPESPETKADETEPKPEEPKKVAPDAEKLTVPEGMPEGFEADPSVFGALADVANELDLSHESAQKIVDNVLPALQESADRQGARWRADTEKDQEIGGQKLDENLGDAKRALKAFGSDGLTQLLDGPIGNHPEVVRFLVKVGRTVSEDKFVSGKPSGQSVDPNDRAAVAAKLYPKSAT